MLTKLFVGFFIFFFYILLTVHPNMIVFFYQLNAQIRYFNTFNILLYVFRAILWSSSGGQIVLLQHLVTSLSLGDRSDHRLRQSSHNPWGPRYHSG